MKVRRGARGFTHGGRLEGALHAGHRALRKAAHAWAAGVPAVADVDPLASYLRGVPAKALTHTAQVFAFDREARLVYRTGDSPPAALVVELLAHIARQG